MVAILLVCVGLACLAGFAVQRASVCVVAAARDGVIRGRWGGFLAFAECAAWALIFYGLLDALGLRAIGTYSAQANAWAALFGGALFGCGALLNGACAYGAVGRLAAGETSFLLMVVGFFWGAWISEEALLPSFSLAVQRFPLSGLAAMGLGAALTVFALAQFWRGWRSVPNLRAIGTGLLAKKWPISAAMAVIALSNVGLIALLSHWTYTGLLIDLAAGHAAASGTRALLALVFFAGAVWGAVTAGRFRWRGISWHSALERGGGGAVMGAGAALIPGGNDGLVVMGVPLLLPGALLAYASMSAVVMGGFVIQRRFARAPV